MHARDALRPLVAAPMQGSQSGCCTLRDYRAHTYPFPTTKSLPLQMTIQTHLAYTSPVTSEQMLRQPKYFIFQNKNQFQPEGWPTRLINKWATMPMRHWPAKLQTSLAPSATSKLFGSPWLPRPVPHNDLGRISLMQRLPLGHIFWLPGPQISEVDTSYDFWDTVSHPNLPA